MLLYVEEKRFTEAFELVNQLLPLSVSAGSADQIHNLCYAYAASGDMAHAKPLLEKILKEYPGQNLLNLAYIYIALKNYSEALNMLESAYRTRDINLYWIKVDPVLDPIRNEPRFKELLKKMRLE